MKSTEEKLLLRRRGGGSVIERPPVFSSDAEYVFIYYDVMLISRLCIMCNRCLMNFIAHNMHHRHKDLCHVLVAIYITL
jgi:hypothetical protein